MSEETQFVNKEIKKRKVSGDFIFYCLLLAFPIIQFCIFYIGVNFSSIMMSFQRIDISGGKINVTWTFDTLKEAFHTLTATDDKSLGYAMVNSLKTYFLTHLFSIPLGLTFAYYISKKFAGASFFRVILFLPSIISAVVTVMIFYFLADDVYPYVLKKYFGVARPQGLLEADNTRYFAIMFFTIFTGFGSGVLIYANEMSSVSQEIIESAQLDGATPMREFFSIVFPLIFPTFSTFFITGLATLFTNTLNLFLFYEMTAPRNVATIGYHLLVKVKQASSQAQYPLLSAMGLLLSIVTVSITLGIRWALEKVDPNRE